MRKYTDEQIQEAKNLRKTHDYSFQYLQQLTGIPASTMKNWCKNEPIISKSTSFLKNNERRRLLIKSSELPALSNFESISTETSKVLVSLLYWCEVAKYPSSNALIFVNSDQALMKTYIFLLRKAFELDESKFSVQLQIHSTHDFPTLRTLWSNLLQIPDSRFIKPTITEKMYGKHRVDYQGTCTLKYQDVKIQLKVIGLYEGFSQMLFKPNLYSSSLV